jgi:glycosyltransferase involved in cell wall biosynthesis
LIRLTVIIPAHNPHGGRLRRTLEGLLRQTLPPDRWETLLIDNASATPLLPGAFSACAPVNLRIIVEPVLGLSHARRRGFLEARGEWLLLVDDDNVLAPDYLENALALFAAHPRVGALGGRVLPEFETAPHPWQAEFFNLLALRDPGPKPLVENLRTADPRVDHYPLDSPVGAGMALRRSAAQAWLDHADPCALTDRRGNDLSSSGDNDIVIHVLRAGWDVAYFPELALTHLIPAARLDPAYLARLNRGIQKSWMQLLIRHGLSDWPTIPCWTVPLRKIKAWFTCRAWSSPAARIRWQGACGHFDGRMI